MENPDKFCFFSPKGQGTDFIPELQCLGVGQLFGALHPLHHHKSAPAGQLPVGGVDRGRVGQAGQHHTLGAGQLPGGLAKVALCSLCHAGPLVAEVAAACVHLKDLLFGVVILDVPGGKHLRCLAGHLLFLGEQLVLGQLLGQGAAALGQRAGAQVGPERPDNGRRVDAVVLFKPAVLHGNDCVDIGLGQLVTAGKAGPGADLIIEAGNGLLRRCGAIEPPALHAQCSANDHQYKQRRQQQAAEQSLYKTFQHLHVPLRF